MGKKKKRGRANAYTSSGIHEAVKKGWAGRVSELASRAGGVNQPDLRGQTPLQTLATMSEEAWVYYCDAYRDIAMTLVWGGADEEDLRTSLQIAINFENRWLAEFLREHLESLTPESEDGDASV